MWVRWIETLFFATLLSVFAKQQKRDPNDNKGNTAFFLQHTADSTCLGPNGFTVCDETSIWILTKRPDSKWYSLVSLFNSNEQGLCLEVKSGWLGGKYVGMGSCARKGSKLWEFDFVGSDNVKLHSGGYHLARGHPFKNSLTMQPSKHGRYMPLKYQPTAIHESGFYLKAQDGSCFDGETFGPCSKPARVLWGLGVRYEWGVAKRYLFNFREHQSCIESKHRKVFLGKYIYPSVSLFCCVCELVRFVCYDVCMCVIGSCSSKYALGWSLHHGKLQFDLGNAKSSSRSLCVARRAIDNTAQMVPCVQGFEYVTMELPATYS